MKFKNILLYAALLSGMSFSSCTDFLDEDSNPNALSPGIFWKSEGDIMKGLTSVYGALQPNASWAIPFERYIVIDGYRSDEITHRDDVTSWMNISSFNVEPTNSVVKTEWTNLYKGINYANQCLTNIPTVPGGLDDGIKRALHTCKLLLLGINGCAFHFVCCGGNFLKHFSIKRLDVYGRIFKSLGLIAHNAGIYNYLCHVRYLLSHYCPTLKALALL